MRSNISVENGNDDLFAALHVTAVQRDKLTTAALAYLTLSALKC